LQKSYAIVVDILQNLSMPTKSLVGETKYCKTEHLEDQGVDDRVILQ
jgi:hypothetical protein